MPNGIYIQTEYHGKLIRKIVCNGDERWFIGSNCAVTFMSMDDCNGIKCCRTPSYAMGCVLFYGIMQQEESPYEKT